MSNIIIALKFVLLVHLYIHFYFILNFILYVAYTLIELIFYYICLNNLKIFFIIFNDKLSNGFEKYTNFYLNIIITMIRHLNRILYK
jgi:hypothetical protein